MKAKIIILLTIGISYLSILNAQYTFTGFDLSPGPNGAQPNNLVQMNGKLYFFGSTLSVSDGTIGGTYEVSPQLGQYLTAWNSKLYFMNFTDGELWRSDGTDTGTYLLKDIYVGANQSLPTGFTPMNGKLYFAATTFNGTELWVTDGSAAGTMMVKDTYPGVASGVVSGADIFKFVVLNSVLYFNASDGVNGLELWRSDGTSAGTYMLKDIATGASSSNPYFMKTVGNKIYFYTQSNGTYISDGTNAGTIPIGMGVNSNDFTYYNGMVYYAGGDGVYRTDGTAAGTSLFKSGSFALDSTADFTIYNSELYFCIDGEPWVTDGTTPGTHILKDSICLTSPSFARNLSLFDNKIFFVASDLYGHSNDQLYVSDGTSIGTHVIMPPTINHVDPLFDCFEYVHVTSGITNSLFFKAHYDDIGLELWKIGPGWIGIENETIDDFGVHPNPTTDMVYFTAGENINDASVKVYDLNGKILISQTNLNSLQLNLSGLSSGMYLIGVKKENKESFIRIVKQ